MSPQTPLSGNQINENNIGQFEKEALESVKKTIGALEQAIAAYEGAKEKPKELEESYRRYKWMQEELSKWAREFLLNSGKPRAFSERISDLRKLARISFSSGVI